MFCQVLTSNLLLLLLVVMQIPQPGATTAPYAPQDPGKYQQPQQGWWWLPSGARPGEAFSPLENVTRSDTSATPPPLPARAKAAAAATKQSTAQTLHDDEEEEEEEASETQEAGQASQVEANKAAIIREFVLHHGEAIRKSRRHADMFDGNGYLIDLKDELREFQGRAGDGQTGRRRSDRKRRSAPDDMEKEESAKDDAAEVPTFASLSDALDYLNGGKQAEIFSDVFNLTFHSDEADDKANGGDTGDRRRRKRSIGEGEQADEEDMEKEAERSLARLDANLQELARYLDNEAAADAAAEQEERQQAPAEASSKKQQRQAFAKFNRHIGNAYKQLFQLRTVASGLISDKQKPAPERLRHLFPEKSANWRIEAATLRENVRQLERMYRQMDEL